MNGPSRSLKERGVHFEVRSFKNGVWRRSGRPIAARCRRGSSAKRKLQRSLNRKKEKVKPGYKKKKAALVKQIQRKERRAMIQSEIQAQRKERYKALQRQKREEGSDE